MNRNFTIFFILV